MLLFHAVSIVLFSVVDSTSFNFDFKPSSYVGDRRLVMPTGYHKPFRIQSIHNDQVL